MTLKLDLITIVLPDYQVGIDFFVGGLGFALISDIDQGRKRWVVVRPPGGGVDLLLAKASDARQSAAIGNQTGGRVGFFLRTGDFAADAQRIKDAGGVFLEKARDEPYGRVAQWRDPWGNLWDLIGHV